MAYFKRFSVLFLLGALLALTPLVASRVFAEATLADNLTEELDSPHSAVELPTYSLFSGVAAGGWGTITRDPVLTDHASYLEGTVITLEATPKGECNEFDHWIIGPGVTNASSTDNPIRITISATGPRAIAAHFVGDCYVHDNEIPPAPTYSLFSGVAAGGWGTIIRDPAPPAGADHYPEYPEGTVITLEATTTPIQAECNQFDHWIIGPGVSNISTTTNPVSVTISATGPRAVAAHFVGDCYVHDNAVSRSRGQQILPPPADVGQVLGVATLTSPQRTALILELKAQLIALLQQLRGLLLAQLASLGH